ncbi:hypothetical protein LshimejAT787_0805800 [Lyophyllum shimeji]|uniref:Uncharacterized protein n=1 Tax=Lyophyllum shimeji TaxID=47721 RepID=A0A9P3PSH7_LYOSH|nr:hypothetical protein LshimejAT787_0805800 [Lyophyllum shimeji]
MASATAMAVISSSVSPLQVLDRSRASYSRTLSTLIAVGSALFFATYLYAFVMTYRYARSNPRGLNKPSGVRLQRYAPAFYLFIVMSSLIEISLTSWLLIQDAYLRNSPNAQTHTAAVLLLFCACWTSLTGGTYSLLFLHPTWAEHPVASIGAQWIWVLATWLLWLVGAGLLNGALPDLLVKARCMGLVYCSQIRGLFAIAVIEVLTLTVGMGVLVWLAWGSAANIRLPRRSGHI